MSNQLTNQLFTLIKSLTKSEKRHFTLYAKRTSSDKKMKFLDLFKVLDLQDSYDEDKLLKRIPNITKNQLSNLKAHLYDQLLVSLRLLNRKEIDIQIREIIDFSKILYNKGLFLESLSQLAKVRGMAESSCRLALLLEILEFEKSIESQYITRSHESRSEELTKATTQTRGALILESKWSDFSLQLYGLYLKIGHVRNSRDYEQVRFFFKSGLPEPNKNNTGFYGKVYECQSYVWYNYIVQQFDQCYRHSSRWLALFEDEPQFKTLVPGLYMKALHNIISAVFFCYDLTRFNAYYQILNDFINDDQIRFSQKDDVLAFLYHETAKINLYFLTARFTEGLDYLTELDQKINQYEPYIDDHRKLVFFYKMACMKFGAAEYKGCIEYLNRIINDKSSGLREDLQSFSRILSLIAHYELGNDDLIDYQIRSTYRFLLKIKDVQMVQAEILKFLKQSVYMDRSNMTGNFKVLKNSLERIFANKYERRPFLYLDLLSWLESKIDNLPVEQIIKRRLEEGKGYRF